MLHRDIVRYNTRNSFCNVHVCTHIQRIQFNFEGKTKKKNVYIQFIQFKHRMNSITTDSVSMDFTLNASLVIYVANNIDFLCVKKFHSKEKLKSFEIVEKKNCVQKSVAVSIVMNICCIEHCLTDLFSNRMQQVDLIWLHPLLLCDEMKINNITSRCIYRSHRKRLTFVRKCCSARHSNYK